MTDGRAAAAAAAEPRVLDAVRAAMLSIKGYKGAEGEYNFDGNGDGLHGYNVVKNVGGKIEFAKHIEFPA